jgi:streptogramin lyase
VWHLANARVGRLSRCFYNVRRRARAEFPLPAGTVPEGIVTGSDGNLWSLRPTGGSGASFRLEEDRGLVAPDCVISVA